jgi:hypothetical protein
MPEPPADTIPPSPNPLDNPFGQPNNAQPPAAAESALPSAEDTAPALDNASPLAPGVTEPDNPFAPRPGATETTPPAETTPTPAIDNPFTPRDSSPPPAADENNPFGARPGAVGTPTTSEPSSTEQPAANPFVPGATEPSQAVDNPFAPRPADAGSTPDDPFRLPTDPARPPMSEVNEAPMDNAPPAPSDDALSAPISDTEATTDPEPAAPMPASAVDNPFAAPASDRVSSTQPVPEPADAIRVWTDITGKHRVRGQMTKILIAEQKVRILKDTGKYTTVPFARLSEADRTFVARHTLDPSTLLAETR